MQVGGNKQVKRKDIGHVISLVPLGRPMRNSLRKPSKSIMMCLVIRGGDYGSTDK